MEKEGKDVIVTTIRKKHSGLNALWAAIRLFFRTRPNHLKTKKVVQSPKEEIELPESNETTWKDIVGGIRPLHLQPLETQTRKTVSLLPPPPPLFNDEDYHDVLVASPERSDDGMSSRYASAEDLQALVAEGGAEEEESGSDVINVQAEEFIAKFYEQIKLQRLQSLYENGMGVENRDR